MPNRNHIVWAFLFLILLPACASFSQLVRHSDPLTPEQHMQLGASYEAQGLNDSAGQQYEAALQLDGKYIPALMAGGNIAFANGDMKKAEASYRRVLRLDPNHAGANNNLAMVFLSRGKDMEQAERYAQIALNQGGPLRPYVLETLAEIYIRQARTSEAQKTLDEADAVAFAVNKDLCEQLAKTRQTLETNIRSQ